MVTVFGAYLARSGWDFYDGTTGQLSAAVGYPIELLHSAAMVSGGLIVLHGLARLGGSFTSPAREEAGPAREEAGA